MAESQKFPYYVSTNAGDFIVEEATGYDDARLQVWDEVSNNRHYHCRPEDLRFYEITRGVLIKKGE